MRYLIIALILIFIPPANAAIELKPTDEYCEPIREFTWNIRDRVIHPIRAEPLCSKKKTSLVFLSGCMKWFLSQELGKPLKNASSKVPIIA